eukprot:1469073-Amphidinium_carterae.1
MMFAACGLKGAGCCHACERVARAPSGCLSSDFCCAVVLIKGSRVSGGGRFLVSRWFAELRLRL